MADAQLRLTDIGEPLVAAMLAKTRRGIVRLLCALCDCSLAESLQDAGVRPPYEFLPNSAGLHVETSNRRYALDGAQRVDVLCSGSNEKALALELKLGRARLSANEFVSRFCSPCQLSNHSPPRINGSLTAVLQRLLPVRGAALRACCNGRSFSVADNWWLVIRRSTYELWRPQPPALAGGHVLLLEEVVRCFGGEEAFNELVEELIGRGFYRRWGLE